MTSCEHLLWLQIVDINEIQLLDLSHMSQLMRGLRDSANQQPSTVFFVEQQAKNAVVKELFCQSYHIRSTTVQHHDPAV